MAVKMRNRLGVAMLSFDRLKGGKVSVEGSTGAMLDRSLKELNDLISRSVSEIRMESTIQKRGTIEVGVGVKAGPITGFS